MINSPEGKLILRICILESFIRWRFISEALEIALRVVCERAEVPSRLQRHRCFGFLGLVVSRHILGRLSRLIGVHTWIVFARGVHVRVGVVRSIKVAIIGSV